MAIRDFEIQFGRRIRSNNPDLSLEGFGEIHIRYYRMHTVMCKIPIFYKVISTTKLAKKNYSATQNFIWPHLFPNDNENTYI